jgi:hypothetical protein
MALLLRQSRQSENILELFKLYLEQPGCNRKHFHS